MFALLTNLLLFCVRPALFDANVGYLFLSIFFLTAVPLLAYPLAKVIRGYREYGRDGQRALAFVLALLGFTLGFVCALVFALPPPVKAILSGYFFSGALLAFFNKGLRIKASGHACGTVAPVLLLCYFLGAAWAWTLLLIPLVFWARLVMGRHTLPQLIWGSMIGIVGAVAVVLIFL